MQRAHWWRGIMLMALLLPLAVFLFFPDGSMSAVAIWFWILLLGTIWLVRLAWARTRATVSKAAEPEPHLLADEPEPIREVMDAKVAVEQLGVRIFRGTLRESATVAYQKLKQALGPQTVPLIQEDDQLGAAILLMPKSVEQARLERRPHLWVNWLLFALTVLTTTWAGAAHQGVDLLQAPGRFAVGLPYSLGLLAILGVHELGHFFAGRHHGMEVTPPYFIPVPFALGTFGAFIKMRSPPEDRSSLFDMAVAGPLAGLVIAIPTLLIGLHASTVIGSDLNAPRTILNGSSVSSSILFAMLAKLSLGPALHQGNVLRLSPLAFAGWLGLVITALNLLPIGQLDGGHMTRAMFGNRAGQLISRAAMWSLLLLAVFVWPGLMIWVIVVFFLAGHSTPPLNDLTPINSSRRWLGYFTFALLALMLIPLPLSWWNRVGIYAP